MLGMEIANRWRHGLRILCLGAHSDDIEIGCGGTILKLLSSYKKCEVGWIVFGSDGAMRRQEALKSASKFLTNSPKKTVLVKDFRTSFFQYEGCAIKEYFEELNKIYDPDVIFTHFRSDLHQDHRVISELTWNTFRNHFILEYEVPKYDGDLGTPNYFVSLEKFICAKKIKYLLETFATQKTKHWFTEDTFWGLLRIRGIEICAPEQYSEAFYCRKTSLQI